jgi:hypothetical protein
MKLSYFADYVVQFFEFFVFPDTQQIDGAQGVDTLETEHSYDRCDDHDDYHRCDRKADHKTCIGRRDPSLKESTHFTGNGLNPICIATIQDKDKFGSVSV